MIVSVASLFMDEAASSGGLDGDISLEIVVALL